jgi:nucleoside-diphosphate-sugar epimerase
MKKILVAGASGLVGGFLVRSLLADGISVRAVGRKPVNEWKQSHKNAENFSMDLSLKENAYKAVEGVDEVYNLAANIGGVNFISNKKADTMLSVLINTHLLLAGRDCKINKNFYSSTFAAATAEVPHEGKALTDVIEDGHIWEKLFSEKLCKYFREDYNVNTRIGRLQNVYGPYDEYDGGKERAPAALCRKAIIAKNTGNHELEIWGDGMQIRSFIFAPDVVAGIRKLMDSDIVDPVRIGSKEFVTINQLVDAVENAAKIKFKRIYNTSAPSGITRSVPPETKADIEFDWKSSTSLMDGIKEMYDWIERDMKTKGKI